MTIPEIISAVSGVIGSYSEPTFRRDCKRLKIKPSGFRNQKPQIFSPQTPTLILASRGHANSRLDLAPMTLPPLDTAAARVAKLPSMAELRKVRRSAKTSNGKATR